MSILIAFVNDTRGRGMKYFRHLTTGRNGDRLKPLYAEFGKSKGYGLYFMLLEMCGEKYNGTQTMFRFLETELRSELQLSKKSLETLLKLLKKYELVSDYVFTENSRVIELTVPDLIKISDDYSRKVRTGSGHESNKCPPIDIDIKEDININKKEDLKTSLAAVAVDLDWSSSDALLGTLPKESRDRWIQLYGDEEFIVREIIKAHGYYHHDNPAKEPKSRRGWLTALSRWLERGWTDRAVRTPGNKKQETFKNSALAASFGIGGNDEHR